MSGSHWNCQYKLNYSKQKLTDDDLLKLPLWEGNYTYEEVDFSQNNLTSAGLRMVLELCQRSPKLRVLKFFKNQVDDSGAEGLAQLCRRCPAIEEMHLSHNHLTGDGVDVIITAAERSRPSSAVPLWLRLEQNNVVEPMTFLAGMQTRFSLCLRKDESLCSTRMCYHNAKVHLPFFLLQRSTQFRRGGAYGRGGDGRGGDGRGGDGRGGTPGDVERPLAISDREECPRRIVLTARSDVDPPQIFSRSASRCNRNTDRYVGPRDRSVMRRFGARPLRTCERGASAAAVVVARHGGGGPLQHSCGSPSSRRSLSPLPPRSLIRSASQRRHPPRRCGAPSPPLPRGVMPRSSTLRGGMPRGGGGGSVGGERDRSRCRRRNGMPRLVDPRDLERPPRRRPRVPPPGGQQGHAPPKREMPVKRRRTFTGESRFLGIRPIRQNAGRLEERRPQKERRLDGGAGPASSVRHADGVGRTGRVDRRGVASGVGSGPRSSGGDGHGCAQPLQPGRPPDLQPRGRNVVRNVTSSSSSTSSRPEGAVIVGAAAGGLAGAGGAGGASGSASAGGVGVVGVPGVARGSSETNLDRPSAPGTMMALPVPVGVDACSSGSQDSRSLASSSSDDCLPPDAVQVGALPGAASQATAALCGKAAGGVASAAATAGAPALPSPASSRRARHPKRSPSTNSEQSSCERRWEKDRGCSPPSARCKSANSSPNLPPGDFGSGGGGGMAPHGAVGTLVAVGANCSSGAVGAAPAEPPREAKVRMETLKERLTQKWASKAPQASSRGPAQQLQRPPAGRASPKVEHRIESDPEL